MDLEHIQNKIYEIRGHRVMLDFDLAEIYGVETAHLKRQVRRNIDRFEGDDFMFELLTYEMNALRNNIRCQNGILQQSWFRYPPFAFTELGIAMLSSVLNSQAAIKANRNIMRAFVAMRQLILNPQTDRVSELEARMRELKEYIEGVFTDQNEINEDTRMQLELINQALAELQAQRQTPNSPRRRIGYRTSDEDEFI